MKTFFVFLLAFLTTCPGVRAFDKSDWAVRCWSGIKQGESAEIKSYQLTR